MDASHGLKWPEINKIPSFQAWFSREFGLGVLNQFFNALGIRFGMSVAADGIAPAG
jgi:protoporphyrinogen oxidase